MTSPPESTSSKRTLVDSDSDSDCSAPALSVKRPRTDDDASSMLESKVASIFNKAVREPTSLNREELEDKSHEELVELVVLLQQRVRSAEKTATEPKRLSKEEVDAVVAVQRRVMVRGISAQMGWKPSCKTGTAKFSYTFILPSYSIFISVFNLPSDTKKKMFKLSIADFEAACGSDGLPTKSVRYDMLRITGLRVNLKWTEGTREVSATGSYGKSR